MGGRAKAVLEGWKCRLEGWRLGKTGELQLESGLQDWRVSSMLADVNTANSSTYKTHRPHIYTQTHEINSNLFTYLSTVSIYLCMRACVGLSVRVCVCLCACVRACEATGGNPDWSSSV